MAQDPQLLQALLEEALGTTEVYSQPPADVLLNYPCVIFNRSGENAEFADNELYQLKLEYTVTLISRDPDDPAWSRIRQLPYCSFDRAFKADNLNHDVFTIFF